MRRSDRAGADDDFFTGTGFDAFFNPLPQNFQLKTQTSEDVEGGFRVKTNLFQVQTSVYLMDLENEIHFNPVLFYNVNLDPTRRYGSETSASLKVSDSVTLRGGMAITRAVFRDGMWAGNDVPLVSRYTGNIGLLRESAVLLTGPQVRPYVRSIIERFRGQTVVMSQNEVHPKARLRTIGTV